MSYLEEARNGLSRLKNLHAAMCVVQGPDAEDALISEATLAVAISNAEHLARLNENMSRLIKILDSIDKSLDAEVGVQMDGGK